jgi:hypothetical protein
MSTATTTKNEEILDSKAIDPLAQLFPPMSDDEFAAMAEDIKEHGLVDPIILHEGKILDGVHRLRACLQESVKPAYKKWDGEGGTPFQYVWSKNWARRNLTASQRAVVALAAEKEFAVDAAKRMSPHGRAPRGVEIIPHVSGAGKAREEAGRLAGVNAHYVQDAKMLKKEHPDLLEEVRLGRLNIPAAMQQAKHLDTTPSDVAANNQVRIVFMQHVLLSEKMSKTEAKELADGLVEKDISVRLISKTPKADKAKPSSNMYADTQTWNPFVGCAFDCTYCVPSFQAQKKRQKNDCDDCYTYKPHQHRDRLGKIPANVGTIFVCGAADMKFCKPDFMRKILDDIKAANEKQQGKAKQTFYMQSKQPECFELYLDQLPDNVVLVTTLETNRDAGYDKVSKAPPPSKRFKQFLALDYPRKVVTIEPVMDFDTEPFAGWITRIKPERVWLGYNSREASVMLPEPPHKKLMEFASLLVEHGIEVWGKDWRGLDMPSGVKPTKK